MKRRRWGLVICSFEKAVDHLVLALLLAPFCTPLDAFAQSAHEVCAKTPASKHRINVKDRGAKGDGRTDDTAAVQKAIDEVSGTGRTVLVPNGIYMINAVGERRLSLRNNTTLRLSEGATLKEGHYAVLTIAGVSNVTVIGGLLEGDRDKHQGAAGEWGMGIRIERGARHITIAGVTARKMWGDGFYIEGAEDVTLCAVVADHNRRQGLSVIEVDGLVVTNSVFKNTRGTRPSAGIDLEPDRTSQTIANVRIAYSKFLDNVGPGILISGQKGADNFSNVEIAGNLFRGTPPVKIKYAPGVSDSAICRNRYIVRLEPSPNLASVASRSEEVTLIAGCGDPGLRTRQ